MKGRRPWVIGFMLALLLLSICAQIYRSNNEKFVVGLWAYSSRHGSYGPVCLRLFSDHTYTVESSNSLLSKSGKWKIAEFPPGQVVLEDWSRNSDDVAPIDVSFALDVGHRTMERQPDEWRQEYRKESDLPQLAPSPDEMFIPASWEKGKKKDDHYIIYIFMSDHRFVNLFEGSGTWRLVGDKVMIDWVSEDDEKSHREALFASWQSKKLTEANGHALLKIE